MHSRAVADCVHGRRSKNGDNTQSAVLQQLYRSILFRKARCASAALQQKKEEKEDTVTPDTSHGDTPRRLSIQAAFDVFQNQDSDLQFPIPTLLKTKLR